jgi:cold shock CspA family protein
MSALVGQVDVIFHETQGHVVSFDDASGLGIVETNGGDSLPFHCISIADGTRMIAAGASVSFSVEFRVKRAEAVNLVIH